MTSLPAGSVILGSLLFAFSAAARTDAPPVDSTGKPVCDANGQPLIYSQKESKESSIGPLISGKSLPITAPKPDSTSSSGTTAPFWGYGVFGSNIGLAGMLPVTNEHGLELVVSGTSSLTFGQNDFWYVLSHDPEAGGYQQVHVQAPYGSAFSGQIASMSLANLTGDAAQELVVGLTDGRFFFYSTSTYEELGTRTPVTNLTDFATADLDGDGTAELIILSSSNLKVFNSAGQLLWSVSGPGGTDLVVAQMDQDPALEIATTSGHVVDASSHSVQWNRVEGFGKNLRAADIDGDERAELIAADDWYDIYAYDVDLQASKWSYRTSHDIESIEIANVDGDPAMELLYGDGQWGELHVLTLNSITPVEEWHVSNSEHGVQRIAVADADADGVPEILWTSGGTSTGRDRLAVHDTTTHQLEWESIHLDGPFLSPVIGDVTGDGVPELVTACSESNSSYSSGRILVFDSATLKLLGISQPIADNYSWTGLRDLKLRDVNGDGRLEIVVAADWLYDGLIEVYSFTDARTFERTWTNNNRPFGEPFSQVDLLDVDNDGNLEIVAGNDTAHTGSTGNYIWVIDYATKAQEWRSPQLESYWDGVHTLAIGDVDGDGHPEAVVSVAEAGISVLDLTLRSVEFTQSGDFSTVAVRPGRAGFLVGTKDGKVNHFHPHGARGYDVVDSWAVSSSAVTGLTPVVDDDALWVNADERVSYWPNSTGATWTSDKLGADAVGPIGLLETTNSVELFVGASHAVSGFGILAATPPEEDEVIVSVTANDAEASEPVGKTANPGKFVFHRTGDLSRHLEVEFDVGGTATPGVDYRPVPNRVIFPSGASTISLTISPRADHQAEATEQVELQLLTSTRYLVDSLSTATITVEDREAVVSIDGTQTTNGRVVLNLVRTGEDTQPLTVTLVVVSGETMHFQRVTFKKGAGSAQCVFRPKKKATQTVQISAELLDDGRFHLGNTTSITFDVPPQ